MEKERRKISQVIPAPPGWTVVHKWQELDETDTKLIQCETVSVVIAWAIVLVEHYDLERDVVTESSEKFEALFADSEWGLMLESDFSEARTAEFFFNKFPAQKYKDTVLRTANRSDLKRHKKHLPKGKLK
jgi:hypothetical protein